MRSTPAQSRGLDIHHQERVKPFATCVLAARIDDHPSTLQGVDQHPATVRQCFAESHSVSNSVTDGHGEGTPIVEMNTGPGGIYARIEDAGHMLDHFTEEVSARMPTPDGTGWAPQPARCPASSSRMVASTWS
jgi:hypothetical protein